MKIRLSKFFWILLITLYIFLFFIFIYWLYLYYIINQTNIIMKKININDLKPGLIIMFKSSKGHDTIGKITSINPDNDTILMHDMILLTDFTPLRGKWGGLNIGIEKILQIIQRS